MPRRLLRLEVRKITASTPLSRQTLQLQRLPRAIAKRVCIGFALSDGGIHPTTWRCLIVPIQSRPIVHHSIEGFIQCGAAGGIGPYVVQRSVFKSPRIFLVQAPFKRLMLELIVLSGLRECGLRCSRRDRHSAVRAQ